ncbi:DNA-binding transcriptional regulator [Xanthomonas sp. Kuri4-1]
MKQRPATSRDPDAGASLSALAHALAHLQQVDDVVAFLRDLCTPAELEAMSDRWRVVPLLLKGVPYREIHDLTQVSVTTIGRVARTLEHGAGGYAAALREQPRAPTTPTEIPK